MEHITLNAVLDGKPRTEQVMGRDYAVFPAVLVRSQVLNNNLGVTFLPADEIKATVGAWNGVPVTIGHPLKDGAPISARDPDVLNAFGVGQLFRARFEDDALKADVFVDLARTGGIDGADAVVTGIHSGQVGEISTGFGTVLDRVEGSHNGERYDAVMRNVQPDHLALLVGQKGACSVSDGCGLGVNCADGCTCGGDKTGGVIKRAVDKLVAMVAAKAKNNTPQEGLTMNRETTIAQLAENGPLSAERLGEMEDDELTALQEALDKSGEGSGEGEGEGAEDKVTALESRIAELEEAAASNREALQAEKEGVVKELAGNARCQFDEPELEAMGLEQLKKLRASLRGENYAGRGGPRNAQNQGDPAYAPVRPYWQTANKED